VLLFDELLALPTQYVEQGVCNGVVPVCLAVGLLLWAWRVGEIVQLLHG